MAGLSLSNSLNLGLSPRGGTSTPAIPWTPVAAFGAKTLTWLDKSDAATITTATGISAWADKSGRGRSFVQATAANQPVNGTGIAQFDGTNDLLVEDDVTFTYNTETAVPDGRGGRGTGLGFSLTHICPDPVTGGLLLANDGRATDPTGAASCTPALMFTDITGGTKIREVPLSDGRSVQGVAFDPDDNNYVWTARPTTSGGAAGSLERVHSVTGAVVETVSFNPNGMAVISGDPTGEQLYFVCTDGATLGTFSFLKRDGTVIRTLATGIGGGIDGLWYDAANGYIWAQTNTVTYVFSLYGKRLATISTGATFNRGEGCCRIGTKIYITHNGSYHASGAPAAVPNVSKVFTYDLSKVQAVGRDGRYYGIFWLGNHNGAPAANRVLFGHNNPLSGIGLSTFSVNTPAVGVSHYTNTGASGTTEQGLANWTASIATRGVWSIIVDAVAETATLRFNSVEISTVSIANITGGRVIAGRESIGGSIESGNPARWSKLYLTEMFEYLGETALTTAQIQKAEAYLGWHDPLGTALANIDASNPYKAVSPTV